MNHADALVLFDHVYWLRDQILERADHPDVPFTTDAPVTTRDLRATLVHELDVEWSWRERLASADPTRFSEDDEELVPADFPDVAAIRERWGVDEAAMRAWLATLDDAQLAAPCPAEHPSAHASWFHLQHLYTHAIQQFSDTAVLLTRAGRSPGELDFLEFAQTRRTHAGGPSEAGS
jgi:uncharacterized damage-inducible protein DinB